MTSAARLPTSSAAAELDRILLEGLVRAVYQPIVVLDTGEVVGYEALARGPAGSPLELPGVLFAAARNAGRLGELDWISRIAALTGARAAGLREPLRLFVNVEPGALVDAVPPPAPEAAQRLRSLTEDMAIVVELTERDLTADPARLLGTIARVRQLGWQVALDDVGADPQSLALLPLVRPDVIKLDMRLVQHPPDAYTAAVVHAVNAEVERSTAHVLAEGIETAEHLRRGQALGATLGQGWHFARPGELENIAVPDCTLLDAARRLVPGPFPTPFQRAAARADVRRGSVRLLAALSRHLEREALGLGRAAVVLATFEDPARFTPATATRYARLAEEASFVGVIGAETSEEPARRVRGAQLHDSDPLRGEWNLAVLGAHYAGALVARRPRANSPGASSFDFVLTHNRDLVADLASTMLWRVLAMPLSPPAT